MTCLIWRFTVYQGILSIFLFYAFLPNISCFIWKINQQKFDISEKKANNKIVYIYVNVHTLKQHFILKKIRMQNKINFTIYPLDYNHQWQNVNGKCYTYNAYELMGSFCCLNIVSTIICFICHIFNRNNVPNDKHNSQC